MEDQRRNKTSRICPATTYRPRSGRQRTWHFSRVEHTFRQHLAHCRCLMTITPQGPIITQRDMGAHWLGEKQDFVNE